MYEFIVLNKAYVTDATNMSYIDQENIPYVIISVLSPEYGIDEIKLPNLSNCEDHLVVKFHDITEQGNINSFKPVTSPITPINDTHAKQIIDFAMKWKNDVDVFIIHCEAGMSRSPAVAVALSEILNGKEFNHEDVVQSLYGIKFHNVIVKKKILEVYYENEETSQQ